MMWLPAPLPIRRLVWIAFWSLALLVALLATNISIALVSLVLLVQGIWGSFLGEKLAEKVSNSLPSDDWEGILRQMEEKKPEPSDEKKASNVEEIKCTNCQQRLNIPRNHTGLAGCPACMMKILLKDGVITD